MVALHHNKLLRFLYQVRFRREVIIIGPLDKALTSEKRSYSVAEIMTILNIGRSKAYELCRSGEFHIVRIGKTIRVSKVSFDLWLDNIK